MANGDEWEQHEIVDAARAIAPLVAAAGDEIDRIRRLPDPIVEELRSAGVFSMYVPRAAGGAEVHPLTAYRVVEELARADGSVAWCAQVAAAVTVFLAWIDPAGVEAMAAQSGHLHLAGSARPLGRARRAEGGYLVSGHWDFASGIRHANWFLGTSFVERADGELASRSMFMPVDAGTIVPNWDVLGMRGTGSDDFVVQDVFVPDQRAAGRRWMEAQTAPLFDTRLDMVAAWAPTAGVGVGLALGAIDALVALGERRTAGSPVALRERDAVQDATGRAAAMAGAARAYVVDAIGAAWAAAAHEQGRSPRLTRAVADAQLAITHSLNEAVRIADLVFHAAGTNAVSTANRLERFLRDAHTAVQHAAGQPVHLRNGGRVALGLEPVASVRAAR